MTTLHVSCDHCSARGEGCSDCIMSVLLGPTMGRAEFEEPEQRALVLLAEAGLVPPLRMEPGPVERRLRVV